MGRLSDDVERFLYTAWFENPALPVDDQDRTWPACFVVIASDSESAIEWADGLADDYAARNGSEVFLRSTVEPADSASGDIATLPVFSVGEDAIDEAIGW
ncbi:MAG: hypothetical protein RIM72_21580 [Alphaproteobacteria bacterium]